LLLLLLALLTAITKAKVFSRCELALLLQEEGLDSYGGYSLASPLYESTFNTAAQSIEGDGSADYGIFQISGQLWWRRPSGNRCRMACRDLLLSNVTGDIICAKRIVRNPQGMNAWEGWAMHCNGRDLSEWVEGCDL
ncbi:LYZL1 protein, partial [Sagittarius serpentarius]|nr:LYZL1 protein [Sagittarius serpentarius]